ncbi:hypothetical protein PAXINDRAFT_155865 [Paxillus involutus ATCC 200175]|uniref:DEAD/DEAH box helicase domain-containing protein n=1 Tax=Paxillus involutus ATCC 200175 TaxID=664439 RepID=A0A0C9TXL5_PAXIN|nr:hypothetical protein PAXINDRAFT_155865 [Paxillus involutus ATCC 200175]
MTTPWFRSLGRLPEDFANTLSTSKKRHIKSLFVHTDYLMKITEATFTRPSRVILDVLPGKNVVVLAGTGYGKNIVILLPLLVQRSQVAITINFSSSGCRITHVLSITCKTCGRQVHGFMTNDIPPLAINLSPTF